MTQWPSSCPIVTRRPEAGLPGVDPDLAAGGEEQSRQRLPFRQRRRAGRSAHVLDVADQEAVNRVDDVLDRHRQPLAVPDVGRRGGEHLLCALLHVPHAITLDPQALAQAKQRSVGGGEELRGEQVGQPVVARAERMLEDAQWVAVRGHATEVALRRRVLTHR
jgi:hypothetical protein